jgi:hypothetical protein
MVISDIGSSSEVEAGVLVARLSFGSRLEEAVAAYRDALNELTRERVLPHWATTQKI